MTASAAVTVSTFHARIALFTVSFAGLWGQDRLTLEASIDLAADLGYDGVEIMGKRPHLSVLDCTEDDCRRLRERVERQDSRVAAVAAYTDFAGGTGAIEVPFAEMQVAHVTDLARRSAALGCDLVRVFTSYEHGSASFLAAWRTTVKCLRSCCNRAAAHGALRIGVQNHHDIGVDTSAYLELLAEVDRPNIVPMFDCWSPFLRGEDAWLAVAAALASRMPFTTVADYKLLARAAGNTCPRLSTTPRANRRCAGRSDGPGGSSVRSVSQRASGQRFRRMGHLRNVLAASRRCSIANLKWYARAYLDYMRRFVPTFSSSISKLPRATRVITGL